jgi:hypothetical protein
MVVIRCKECGNSIQTWKKWNVKGYSERLSDTPCPPCQGKLTTTEDRLIKAIFGEH